MTDALASGSIGGIPPSAERRDMLQGMITIAGGIILAVVVIYWLWLKPDDYEP